MKKKSILLAVVLILILSSALSACVGVDLTLTFEVDGVAYATVNTSGKEAVTIPEDPTKEGYIFDGWFWDKDIWDKPFTANSLLDAPISKDMTVYAKFVDKDIALKEYTVTYNTMGGSEIAPSTVLYNTIINEPTRPSYAGYALVGWYKNADYSQLWDFITDKVLSDMTLYAKWDEIRYDIIYNLDGGTNNESNPDTYTIKNAITFASPTKVGYAFAGWFDSEIGGEQITEITEGSMGDKTLFARWITNGYTITFEEKGGSTVDDIIAEDGATVTKPADPTRAGHTFGGWFTDDGTFVNEFVFSTMPQGGATVYARWSINQYTITFEENIGSTVDDIIADYGTAVTKPADPTRAGYTFGGWFTDDGTFANEFVFSTMPQGGATVYARWDKRYSTPGLEYDYNYNMDGYEVTKGTANTNGAIIIAEVYDDGRNGEKPVKSIGRMSFDNTDITSITIPDSVTSIGERAFYNCSSLTSIIIPDSVTSIGREAFATCSGLISVTIGNGVTSIGERAFYNCDGLTSITIPDSVTSIGREAFATCSSLTSIIIPDSVTSIGNYAFSECSGLTSVTIGNGVTSIGGGAFYDCNGLTSITIPASVTSIGNSAFSGCSSLTSITIPDSVISIGDAAFYDCNGLTSIAIPNSVTSIGDDAFFRCSSLTSITIPDSVTSIGSRAFSSCRSLTSITIPDSVISIGNSAFKDCYSLVKVNITDIVAWCSISFESYDSNPIFRAESLYLNGKLVTELVIPQGVTSIGSWAFRGCSSLTSITIPASVTSIGSWAFSGCSSLTSITIPDSVTSIGDSAFYDCDGLTSITIGNKVTSIGDSAFSCCSGLTSITIPDSVTSIGNAAFNGLDLLTSITIPDSVTSIGVAAFSGCSSLTSITIGNKVTSIVDNAFKYCSSLTTITIPASVTSIGSGAFADCSRVTSITVDKENAKYYSANDCIVEINTKMLIAGCKSSIIPIDGSVTSIGDYAFSGCSNLTGIVIPDSVTSIGNSAFRNSGLTSVTIPDGVTSIGNDVFSGCMSLTSITIPDSVTSIGYIAFHSCYSLTSIKYSGTTAQWAAITKGDSWNYNTGKYTVYCINGTISKGNS